ncbi:caspase family protein [Desulfocurvus sp. DL9XJH121]
MFLLASTCIAASEEPRKLALVIGNSAYQNATALPNPKNDATAVAAGLKRSGFTVIRLVDANRAQQKDGVGMFLERLREYDVGLFFYAGHGISIDGRNYLIPVDAALRSQIAAGGRGAGHESQGPANARLPGRLPGQPLRRGGGQDRGRRGFARPGGHKGHRA